MAKQLGADGIVVGLPVTENGSLWNSRTDSQMGKRCRNFAEELRLVAKADGFNVVLFDERLTSIAAQLELDAGGYLSGRRRGDGVDSVAAALLLSAYFEEGGRGAVAV